MRPFFIIPFLAITLIGCGSSYIVSSESNDEHLSFSEFNTAAENEEADIVLQDDSILYVRGVRVESDTTTWQHPTTNERVAVPTHRIKKIILTNQALGALEGAGIGFLSGAVLGLVAAVPFVANSNDEYAGFAYIIFPGIGGATGVLTGLIIGIASGHTDKYEFENELKKPSN